MRSKSIGINVLRGHCPSGEDAGRGAVQKNTPWRDRFARERGRLGLLIRHRELVKKRAVETWGAEALPDKEGLIAALKALRHPKAGFSATVSE